MIYVQGRIKTAFWPQQESTLLTAIILFTQVVAALECVQLHRITKPEHKIWVAAESDHRTSPIVYIQHKTESLTTVSCVIHLSCKSHESSLLTQSKPLNCVLISISQWTMDSQESLRHGKIYKGKMQIAVESQCPNC